MKQNRFLGIIFAGFIILGISVSSNLKAGVLCELAEDGQYILDSTTGDMLDLSGKDMTDAEVDAINTAITEGKTLNEIAQSLKMDESAIVDNASERAQSLIKDNTEFQAAKVRLQNDDLTFDEYQAEKASQSLQGIKNDLIRVRNLDKISAVGNRAFNAMEDFADDMNNGLKRDADLFKGSKTTNAQGVETYKSPTVSDLKGMCQSSLNHLTGDDVAGLEKLNLFPKGVADRDALFTEIKNAKTAEQLQNIKMKITKLKQLASLGRESMALDKLLNVVKDDPKALESLQTQIKAVDDFTQAINKIPLDSDVLAEASVKEMSGIEKTIDAMKAAAKNGMADLKGQLTDIDSSISDLEKKLPTGARADLALSRATDSLVDTTARAGKYINSDLTRDVSAGVCKVGRGAKIAGKWFGKKLVQAGEMIFAGTLFMIPNIFQAAFLAQAQRQATLQTLASPIQVGNWVMQIPDSCFNIDNPSATLPIYVRIPVQNVNDTVLPEMQTLFSIPSTSADTKATATTALTIPTISGPSTANAISRAIHTAGAAILSFGESSTAKPNRYHINEASYLAQNPGIILAYFAGGFQPWGSVPVTSQQFSSGQVIDVSTGVIIDGSGNPNSATGGIVGFESEPLLAVTDWHAQPPQPLPQTVKDFMATMQAKLTLTGQKVSYIQNVDVRGGSAGAKASSGLQSSFDCACYNADSATSCSSSQCAISQAVYAYKAGTTLVPLATPLFSPGSILPMFGWGDKKYSTLINATTFPNFSMKDVQLTVSFATDASGNPILAPEHPNIPYALQGCWVYVATNTPFAQAIQGGSSQTDASGPYVDYIIFLNANNQQVPLLVPIEQPYAALIAGPEGSDTTVGALSAGTLPASIPGAYGYHTVIGLNPDIAYWTSIAAVSQNSDGSYSALAGFGDPTSGYPIKYGFKHLHNLVQLGQAYTDQNLSLPAKQGGVIANAIADLENFPLLSNQYQAHQIAMMHKMTNGPFNFGNVSLMLSRYSIQVPGASPTVPPLAQISLYSGGNCFGSNIEDLYVAVDVNNNPLTLPSSNVAMLYSLITDVGYKVQNNSLVAFDFSQANMLQPLVTTLESYSLVYDPNKKCTTASLSAQCTYNVLDTLEQALEGQFPLPTPAASAPPSSPYVDTSGVTVNGKLNSVSDHVTNRRNSWANNFDPAGQKQGITVGGLTCSLPAAFNTKQAIANKAFIYEIVPTPSAAICDNDLFVLTNTSTPSLSSLVAMNAESADASSIYAVSLVTGFVFDMQGNQVQNVSGVPQRLETPAPAATINSGVPNQTKSISQEIFNAVTGVSSPAGGVNTTYPITFTFSNFDFHNTVEPMYQSWVTAYENQMHRPILVNFGATKLGIFAGDDAQGNFIYFPAAGMHQVDYEPTDVFMVMKGVPDPTTAPTPIRLPNVTQQQLIDKNYYLFSLVSGNYSDPTGVVVARAPSASLQSIVEALSGSWGTWLTNTVSTLQADLVTRLTDQQNEQQDLDNILKSLSKSHIIYMTKSSVASIIARLTPGGDVGLLAPYGLLQYDQVKQIYVHLSPLTGQATDGYLYLFFDIGSEKSDAKKRVGGVFTKQGMMIRVVKGIELEAMKAQFGVVVNSDGTQKLGIPVMQPFFKMTKSTSLPLTKGNASSDGDLIISTDPQFPGGSMSLSRQNYNAAMILSGNYNKTLSALYLYYSMTMQSYYLYDVQHDRWISCAGLNENGKEEGFVYGPDGSSIPLAQKVARLQSTTPKQTSVITAKDDMILLYENSNGDMQGYMSNGQNYSNLGSNNWMSSDGATLTVTASDPTYTVVDTNNVTKVYKVSADYVWNSLFEVPIDANGALKKSTGKSYKHAQLVMKNNVVAYLLFNKVMYKVSTTTSSNVYTMKPVDPSNTSQLTLTLSIDPDTQVNFVEVAETVSSKTTTYRYLYILDSLDENQRAFYKAALAGTTSVATHAFPVGPVTLQQVSIGNQIVTVSVPSATTNVLFVNNIPNGSTGLSVVSSSSVQGVPTGPESEIFNAHFTNNVLQSTDGRFFVQLLQYSDTTVSPFAFSYVSNGGYVDLYTGVLYDSTGIPLGYCLNFDDLLAILNQVTVSVVSMSAGLQLQYRSANVINIETAQLQADQQAAENLTTFAATVPSLNVQPSATLSAQG